MKNYLIKMLKICIPLILLFVGIAAIKLENEPDEYQGLPDDDKLLYQFINRQGKILGKKYHMEQSGNGLGGMDKVWLMTIAFDRYGTPINEQEARSLVVHCVEDLLEAINNDEQLRPYLRDYPFTAKNLRLSIINFDKNQDVHYFPNISVVSNSEGKVGFFTDDPSDKYKYHTKKYETYDEAVAILKREHKSECSQ